MFAMLAALVAGCAQPVPMAPAQAPAACQREAAAGGEGTAPSEIVDWWHLDRGKRLPTPPTLIPILYDDSVSSIVVGYLYPGLIGGRSQDRRASAGLWRHGRELDDF